MRDQDPAAPPASAAAAAAAPAASPEEGPAEPVAADLPAGTEVDMVDLADIEPIVRHLPGTEKVEGESDEQRAKRLLDVLYKTTGARYKRRRCG